MQIDDFPEVSEEEWAAATGEPTAEQQHDILWLDSREGIEWCLSKMPKGMAAPKNERILIVTELKKQFTGEEIRAGMHALNGKITEDGDFHRMLIWALPWFHTTYVTHVNHYYEWLCSGRPWAHSSRVQEELLQRKMYQVCRTIARIRQKSRRSS